MSGFRIYLICILLLSVFFVFSNTVQPNLNKVQAQGALVCNLPAPTNFTATASTTNSISLSWTGVPGASFYRLQAFETVSTATTLVEEWVPAGQSSFTVAGLQPGVNYTFKINTVCADNGELGTQVAITEASTIIISEIVLQAQQPNGANNYFATPYQFTWQTSTRFWGEISNRTNPSQKMIFSVNVGPSSYATQGAPVAKVAWLSSSMGATSIHSETGSTEGPVISYISVLLDGVEIYRFEIVRTGLIGIIQRASSSLGNNYVFKVFTSPNQSINDRTSSLNTADEQSAPISAPAPNPFSNFLEVKVAGNSGQPTELSLFSMNGQLIQHASFDSGQASYRLNTASVPTGLYLLRSTSGTFTTTSKVLKLN